MKLQDDGFAVPPPYELLENEYSLLDETDLVFIDPVDRLAAAVPDGEDDPAFGRAVDLHAEIAAVPSAGHVEGGDRLLDRGHLAVERGEVGPGWRGAAQMDRGGIAPFLEIEVGLLNGRSVEKQGVEIARRPILRIEGIELEPVIAGL